MTHDAHALDVPARVQLGHARIARLMGLAGLRALHVKGYAAAPGIYRAARASTDVDLLVAPSDAERACRMLADAGWALKADFAEGSIFTHAATLWHPQLVYVDVHRLFPGLGDSAASTFEALWSARTEKVIAGRSVPVPSLVHQRLIVVVHAARDADRGAEDVTHLRDSLDGAAWAELRAAAVDLGAQAAWAVATGERVDGADAHDTRLFEALRAHETGADLLASRWAAASGPQERFRLLRDVLPVNRAHLAMRLRREPTAADVVREQLQRARTAAAWAWRKAARRGR